MPDTLSQQLGLCIRTLRLQTGLSQVEFGEKCGFYQTYLSRIENGRANPTVNALEVIANGLGITVFDLFDLIKEQMPIFPWHSRKLFAESVVGFNDYYAVFEQSPNRFDRF